MYIAADAEVTTAPKSCPHSSSPLQAVALERVHLVERKVLLHLSEEEKEAVGTRRWVLDTDATNHMTGSRSFFTELNTGVARTIKFGDGSVVAIEGKGTVLFACKNGEHCRLDGVYYIPRLTTNIVSLG